MSKKLCSYAAARAGSVGYRLSSAFRSYTVRQEAALPDLTRPEGLAEHRRIHGDLARSSGRRASPLPHNAGFRISNMTVVQSAHGEAGSVKRWPTRPIRH
ncbi:hypothetical protein ACFVZ3_25060 [Kitasatospora purpeofusca]|uniref:hypothetical protein n=1 Tax=Kitasatospora purpeofusca TaxID=67352 RepID=UPI00364F8B4E